MISHNHRQPNRQQTHATFRIGDLGEPLCFPDASLGGVLAILVLQHLPDPAGFLAEIRRCLRPGGHVLVRAPARGSAAHRVRRSVYYRLRAAFYTHVPGLVDFYDVASLRHVVDGAGLTVVECTNSGSSVTVVARA